jgi:2-keto-3-deoxy-L-rhamnonate aldolase RhmA
MHDDLAPMIRTSSFRQRLLSRERLLGTFVKTPSTAIVEILGLSDLHCACLDAEHAPFDRSAIDQALASARAADLPTFVRVQRNDAPDILNALDLGAVGVFVPHVSSAVMAQSIAQASRYRPAGRGYAGSTRAAGYTTRAMSSTIMGANDLVTVVAQIEDAEALAHIDDIAGVDGIDCLFIGRMDLTVSLGAESHDASVVIDAVHTICAAARRKGRTIGIFATSMADAARWAKAGVSFFLLGSDQQWILQGANALAKAFAAAAV